MTRLRLSALRRPRPAGDDAGVTVVIVALLLTVLLMFVAFAIDGGQGYASHRASQNASDTAALAGVNVLKALKFQPTCGGSVTTNCTNYTESSLVSEIKATAVASGADASRGVSCWLLDEYNNRTSWELCSWNLSPQWWMLGISYGVEVRATQTRTTSFAAVAGIKEMEATTTARAQLQKFAGGTGSPFVTCGVRATMPPGTSNALDWSYDLLTPNGSGGYTVVSGAAGRYYSIQGSQNPSCGADSNTFKGKGDGSTISGLPTWEGITTGNGFQNTVQLAVAGITPCPPGVDQFDGCGMLIPIADGAAGSGASTLMHVVAWVAFQVWGSGNSYTFAGSPSDPVGTSCRNPIAAGGSMKYCGKFLGAATITGGSGDGPAVAGQPIVSKLVD